MKFKIKFLLFALALILLWYCDDEKNLVVVDTDNVRTTVTANPNTNLVLNQSEADDEVLTISWTEPDYGYQVIPNYRLLIDMQSNNFANATTYNLSDETSKSFKVSELNALVLNLNGLTDEENTLVYKVEIRLGNRMVFASEPQELVVTPYSSILDLSTTWGIVGSAANDWGATPDLPFYQTGTANVFAAYVTLIDGEIKFRENNDWTNNYGDDGLDGTLDAGGANIPVNAGMYKITLNLNSLTYEIEPFSWGIIGSAANEWGATPDLPLIYDPYSDVFRAIVTLIDGEMKFRLNNDWTNNFGDDDLDGTLNAGGANIPVAAGHYIVTFDLKNLTYELDSIQYIWGLVGSAYNEWGATPDAQFTRDWTRPLEDVWILRNVTLLDGEFKFRANNEWQVDYGDNGADGILEPGGANIAIAAGTYTITLDFSNPDEPKYTIE